MFTPLLNFSFVSFFTTWSWIDLPQRVTTAGRCAVSFGGWVANLSGSPAGRDTLLEHCSPMRGTIGSIQPHHSITSFALIWPGVYQVEQISQSSKKRGLNRAPDHFHTRPRHRELRPWGWVPSPPGPAEGGIDPSVGFAPQLRCVFCFLLGHCIGGAR